MPLLAGGILFFLTTEYICCMQWSRIPIDEFLSASKNHILLDVLVVTAVVVFVESVCSLEVVESLLHAANTIDKKLIRLKLILFINQKFVFSL